MKYIIWTSVNTFCTLHDQALGWREQEASVRWRMEARRRLVQGYGPSNWLCWISNPWRPISAQTTDYWISSERKKMTIYTQCVWDQMSRRNNVSPEDRTNEPWITYLILYLLSYLGGLYSGEKISTWKKIAVTKYLSHDFPCLLRILFFRSHTFHIMTSYGVISVYTFDKK